MRSTLVAALVACTESPVKTRARRFLVGLSSDELQFIADFLGACILESSERCCVSRSELAGRIVEFQQARLRCPACYSEDRDHKMILLLEFLRRSGLQQFSLAARAGHA